MKTDINATAVAATLTKNITETPRLPPSDNAKTSPTGTRETSPIQDSTKTAKTIKAVSDITTHRAGRYQFDSPPLSSTAKPPTHTSDNSPHPTATRTVCPMSLTFSPAACDSHRSKRRSPSQGIVNAYATPMVSNAAVNNLVSRLPHLASRARATKSSTATATTTWSSLLFPPETSP